jgi:hypothetical protein
MIKKVLNTKPEGARKVGRPRSRWEECVWQDIRILGVKNWRSVAINGEEWRAILRKARPTKGCRANDDDDDKFTLFRRYTES